MTLETCADSRRAWGDSWKGTRFSLNFMVKLSDLQISLLVAHKNLYVLEE